MLRTSNMARLNLQSRIYVNKRDNEEENSLLSTPSKTKFQCTKIVHFYGKKKNICDCNRVEENLLGTHLRDCTINDASSETMVNPVGEASFEANSGTLSVSLHVCPRLRATSTSSVQHTPWIEQFFKKRECVTFVANPKYPRKCGCGRLRSLHVAETVNSVYRPMVSDGLNSAAKEFEDLRSEDDRERELSCPESDNASRQPFEISNLKWSVQGHTCLLPTDAYGTIEFQGGPHPYKAQYLRLSYDSDPSHIMYLLEKVWNMPPPKLIITVHGGTTNFELQPKLARVFRKGLLKAARTTGAWIITSGIHAGVALQVASAVDVAFGGSRLRSKVISIGITPWGIIKKRENLIGQNVVVPYHSDTFSTKGRLAVLNNRHSYFLLADDGTVGRDGAEAILRKRLESYIAQKEKIGHGTKSVPVVCLVIEGGSRIIRSVHDYVTNHPKVPVVVCDGSGRAADLLAFAVQFIHNYGKFSEVVKSQLLDLIVSVFACKKKNAEKIFRELNLFAHQKNLVTVFRVGEAGQNDLDYAILTALLKGQNLSPSDQLVLALAWNRVDIARSDIFVHGQDWPMSALQNAMMEALIHDRVDFVRLLLEHGVSMNKFLTINHLEKLYNTERDQANTLYFVVRDVVKMGSDYCYSLPHIGLAVEKLMGNAYKSHYASEEFQAKYHRRKADLEQIVLLQQDDLNAQKSFSCDVVGGRDLTSVGRETVQAISSSRALSNHIMWRSAYRRDGPLNNISGNDINKDVAVKIGEECEENRHFEGDFSYPFSDLLIWAVLTRRHEMALCMWEHGEEALAKALVACRLYKSLADEAAEDSFEVEICEELRKHAEEFRKLSISLLEHCYQNDDAQTLKLLTYELSNWGKQTCLSLAVTANIKQFFAHPCCQILLADLWQGGLRIRSNTNLKVICGLLCLPFIHLLDFKSREELMLQPQTAAEHEDDIFDTSSSSSSSSESESSSDSEVSADEGLHQGEHYRGRFRNCGGVTSSLSHPAPAHLCQLKRSVSRLSSTSRGTFAKTVKNCQAADSHRNIACDATVDVSADVERSSSMRYTDHIKNGKTFVKMVPSAPRMRPLKLRRKLYEFFMAPITAFWAWSLTYIMFICVNTRYLLVETPVDPSFGEMFCFWYICIYSCEYLRKFVMAEPDTFAEKARYFFSSVWNIITAFAIVTYFLGFTLRYFHQTRPSGRVILSCNSLLWNVKLLDLLSVHPRMGPYITMAGEMVQNMAYMIVLLFVSLLSFGTVRQSITYPNEEWDWILIRNVFYKPYFMLYGEVYADEIDTCGDEAWDKHLDAGATIKSLYNGSYGANCVPGYWIPPLLMTFFLLVANMLLMSMLLAVFNNIFAQIDANSNEIWLFERYRQVMQYESTPVLPPPLTPLYYIWMIIKYIRSRRNANSRSGIWKRIKQLFDYTLKLFLVDHELENLHDFEEECMVSLMSEREYMKNASTEERIHKSSERTELLLHCLNDMIRKVSLFHSNMESRMDYLEQKQDLILKHVKLLPPPFSGDADCTKKMRSLHVDDNCDISTIDEQSMTNTVTKNEEDFASEDSSVSGNNCLESNYGKLANFKRQLDLNCDPSDTAACLEVKRCESTASLNPQVPSSLNMSSSTASGVKSPVSCQQ